MDDLSATAVASPPVDSGLLEKVLSNQLTEQEARKFASESPEFIIFTLLALQQRIADSRQATGPHTPSAAIPPYKKPPAKDKSNGRGKKKKRGGQPGHPGTTRDPLPDPDRVREHQLEVCPQCNERLVRTGNTRSRRSEDIPEDLKPVITEDVIHRDYCPHCRKQVEPKLPDVLPNCTLGNRTLALSALLHFLQGLTISQIVDTFNFHLRMKVTPGGLIQMWHRMANLLFAWYQQIHQESLASAKLHADETGWRVGGKTHWLWCFASDESVFYMIDRSRGSPALGKFFSQAFEGTLISDFWSPYDAVVCADKQKCWPHLLRDMAAVDETSGDHSEWKSFSRRLAGVYRDARKLQAVREEMQEAAYDMSVARLESRLAMLSNESWTHSDAVRLSKRLSKYGSELLTFLWHEEVPSDNNAGERAIRPAVMIRKNSYCNHSDRGALTQSVLMSIFRTLKLRGHQPLVTIQTALKDYAKTGVLPSLPAKSSSAG